MSWRIVVWAVPAVILAALWIRGLWECRHPLLTQTRLGEGSRPLKVLLLADLHAGFNRVDEAWIAGTVASSGADAVLFAGDACSGKRDAPKARRLLGKLGNAARAAGIPAYAVPGNHDHVLDDRDFLDAGFVPLRNKAVGIIADDGTAWTLIGLDDKKRGFPRMPAADSLPAGVPPSRTLILAHNPDAVYLPPPGMARFFACGHFHGGQIWLPFHLEFLMLRHERLASEGVRRGRFERNGMLGYISRGIGCVLVPLRLLDRKSVV